MQRSITPVEPQEVDRHRALHALYDDNVRAIYRHVHRRCGDHDLAQDVTQDVFVSLARSGKDPATVTVAWLKTVARNKMIDTLRRRETFDRKILLLGASTQTSRTADSVGDQLLVASAVEELSALHRSVLMLHYVDGYTVSELAEHFERSNKGAEALVTRARAALRKRLEAANARDRS